MITSHAYIADDIQTLQGGKVAAMGLYADHVLVLTAPEEIAAKITSATPAAISGLSILIAIVGLSPGERKVAPLLLLPDGGPGPQQIPPMNVIVKPGGSANLTFRFAPFLVPQGGLYTLKVPIDGEEVVYKFEVRLAHAAIGEAG